MNSGIPKAFLTIDVEDWFHLDYFQECVVEPKQSCLDGLIKFISALDRAGVKGNFFFLDEIALDNRQLIADLSAKGHGIGSHGGGHVRPLTLRPDEYVRTLRRSYSILRSMVPADKAIGYRAPCFSMDDERLALVEEVGFDYDSSYIQFSQHPLYGRISTNTFYKVDDGIYKRGGFFEFEVTTVAVFGWRVPIAGGGYLRILPSFVFSTLFLKVLRERKNYNFFIHPFELSCARPPLNDTGFLKKARFLWGRKNVFKRFDKLITKLREENYQFLTFDEFISK